MTRAEYLFVIVWIINFIISVLYYLWGALFYVPARERQDKNEEEYLHDNRRTYLIRVIVMVLCPIVGPLFFLVSHLIYMTIFRQEVDLDDVIFSKERVKTNVKADEERERNLVPIEEALAVSDKKNLRMLMLNVIRGDLQDSLESISLALNSEDSETSHYAASVLRDELNDFRVTVQKIYTDMKEEEPDQTDSEEMLIDYMNRILCQKVFTEIEQAKFVMMMEEAAESLYQKNASRLLPQRYEAVCLRLLEQKQFDKVSIWCERLVTSRGLATLMRSSPRPWRSCACGRQAWRVQPERQRPQPSACVPQRLSEPSPERPQPELAPRRRQELRQP